MIGPQGLCMCSCSDIHVRTDWRLRTKEDTFKSAFFFNYDNIEENKMYKYVLAPKV